ncbi:MAG: type II toxin-antitoxin system RelE/ParE family toxin [Chthoniobacterales bacterium]
MATIIRSRLSRLDYEEIWLYIAKDNPQAADRLIQNFEHHLEMLAKMPELGMTEEDLAPDLRSFPVSSYLLYYLPTEKGIRLVRVLHGAQDIGSKFFDE